MSGETQRKSRRVFWIKALLSAAFLILLFSFAGRREFFQQLQHIDPLFFVISFVIAAAQISASCAKWWVLVNLDGERLGFGFLMRNYLIGYYFTNLLPSNIGGDVVRSYFVGRRLGSQAQAAISVFMERFTGSLYLLLLVAFLPSLKPNLYRHPAVLLPALGAVSLFCFLLALALRGPLVLNALGRAIGTVAAWTSKSHAGGRWADRLVSALTVFKSKTEKIGSKLELTFRTLRQNRKAALAVVGWTVTYYALTWVNVYAAYRTFGVRPDFRGIVSLLPTAMLVSSIPITLGSLGIAEGSYVFYFSLVGIDPAATLAMGLFLRFKLLVVGAVGAVTYLTYPHERFDHERLRAQLETGGASRDS